jgi:hypothetical protein
MATTRLALWGASGPLPFHTGFTRNTLMVGRTQLRVPGLPGTLNSIPSKTTASLVSIVSSDTLSVQWLEDPVDTNQILSQDTVRISVSELSQLFNQIISSDTAAVAVFETVALLQQGVVALTSSDTVSITLSGEVSTLNVAITTADTVSVTVADTSSLTTPSVSVATSDTVSVTLTEVSLLNIFSGVLQFASTDQLAVSVNESSVLTQITPTKPARIRIFPLTARIQIVPV